MPNENDRPSVHVIHDECGSERVCSPLHPHEFGPGADIQYKANGTVMQRLDGLKPEEAQYLMQKPS